MVLLVERVIVDRLGASRGSSSQATPTRAAPATKAHTQGGEKRARPVMMESIRQRKLMSNYNSPMNLATGASNTGAHFGTRFRDLTGLDVPSEPPAGGRQQPSDEGYAMAALLVAMSVMAVLMSVAMPTWSHMIRREKEEELIFRGNQYARAIGQYQ